MTETTLAREQKPATDSNVPRIEVTTVYGQFHLMKGNRTVDYNHVKRLKREMEANPDLLSSNPILVNENLYIIDGQHRRLAAQELGVPLYYIVRPGLTLDETRHLNITQKRWQLLDFAQSFADSGRQDYITFLRMHRKYPKIAPGILRIYLIGNRGKDIEGDFRRGEFQVGNLEAAEKNLQRLSSIIDKTHVNMNTPMAVSLLKLFEDPDVFDYELFDKKLDRESARALFEPRNSVRACLRVIEDVYNFQSTHQKRLY